MLLSSPCWPPSSCPRATQPSLALEAWSRRRQPDEQTTEVCLRDTTDAGSSYGDKRERDLICWSGALEVVEPTIGSCVVLQAQGEPRVLCVEPADECT